MENKKKIDSAVANLLLQNLRWWIQASFESPANIGQESSGWLILEVPEGPLRQKLGPGILVNQKSQLFSPIWVVVDKVWDKLGTGVHIKQVGVRQHCWLLDKYKLD